MMSVSQRVADYYKEKHILPAEFAKFRCRHKCDCKDHVEVADGFKFISGRLPAISSGYEKPPSDERHQLPRLLVLSLDWGKDEGSKPSDRGLRSPGSTQGRRLTQAREEREIAARLLRPFYKKLFPQANLDWKEVHHFYARTNSIKCCANQVDKQQAAERLFHNCREYLRPELELLIPDILVTQGKQAAKVVEVQFGETVHDLHTISEDGSRSSCTWTEFAEADPGKWFSAVIMIDRRKVLWFGVPFPHSRGKRGYHPKAGELDMYYERCADEADQFMSGLC
jgi:uracil DNA glycosylase superfamily protein